MNVEYHIDYFDRGSALVYSESARTHEAGAKAFETAIDRAKRWDLIQVVEFSRQGTKRSQMLGRWEKGNS